MDNSLKHIYKSKCKEYETAVNRWHDNRELRLCENPTSRKFFKFVNQKFNTRSSIPPLLDNNQNLLTSDDDRANFFNTQFQSFFVKDDAVTPNFATKRVPEMPSFTITIQDVRKAISEMKDKLTRTPEDIPSYFLKRLSPAIILPLLIIFNTSLQYNIIPSAWKKAIVVPVFKKGNRNHVKNYRPILLTSSICRLFESILSKKILSHLLLNDLLSTQQFGFIPKRSSCSQLLSSLYQWIVAYSSDETTDVIYTDIRKAFDSVSHSKLIYTLRQYKLHPSVVNWIENFLTNRTQQVALNTSLSAPCHAYSGVPQGSIIGPLLFIIYFNDVTESTAALDETGNIMLFADDAKVFSTTPNNLDQSLFSLNEWLQSRQLKLASEKCFLLKIAKDHVNSPTHNYHLDNHTLSCEPVAKDLGIYISHNKWEHHISYLKRIGSVFLPSSQIHQNQKHLDDHETIHHIHKTKVRV